MLVVTISHPDMEVTTSLCCELRPRRRLTQKGRGDGSLLLLNTHSAPTTSSLAAGSASSFGVPTRHVSEFWDYRHAELSLVGWVWRTRWKAKETSDLARLKGNQVFILLVA